LKPGLVKGPPLSNIMHSFEEFVMTWIIITQVGHFVSQWTI
jgi:hypothetical protein